MSGPGGAYWLDTRGRGVLTVGICGRCGFKYPLETLKPDPNFPGLLVCRTVADGCLDEYDPYRLNARQTENITVRSPRPDLQVGLRPDGSPIAPNN